MVASSFTSKNLRFTFQLTNGQSFAGGGDVLQVAGLKARVDVVCAGFPSFPTVHAMVFGMRQADMNSLVSIAFNPNQLFRNNFFVEADSGQGYVAIFAGQIKLAMPDYTMAPAVALRVEAMVMGFDLVNQATATSYTGDTDVATICSGLAAKMGYTFQNNGVEGITLANPYFSGTFADQLRAVAQHAGIDVYMEPGAPAIAQGGAGATNVVIITRKGAPRTLPTFILAPDSGMVGYPIRDSNGYLQVRALFNPGLRFGGPVQLKNTNLANIPGQPLLNADGAWYINGLKHSLESVTPGGAWFSELSCCPPNVTQPSTT
jgi:hypothetical protein